MNLLVYLLAVLVGSAQAPSADPSAIIMLPNTELSGSARCGPDQLTWSNTRSFDPGVPGAATLQASGPDGTLVADLSQPLNAGELVTPLWCADLLGDGSQVLGVQKFSGGAHCCFSVTVVPLAAGATPLLQTDLGNGGLGAPEQIDGVGPLELVGSSDVFAYFDDLSFAASPFMPLIYAYDGHAYVEATRYFPERIQSDLDTASADLAAAVARPPAQGVPAQLRYQEQESVALRVYGLHVLLGDADAALPGIQSDLAPPVATWLAANAPAAQAAMANVYDLGSSAQ